MQALLCSKCFTCLKTLHCTMNAVLTHASVPCIDTAGADAAIVRRTQAAIAAAGEHPVHFSARFAVPGTFTAALFVAYGGLMMFLCRFSWGRALLLRWEDATCIH
jgi:hypothetical protein